MREWTLDPKPGKSIVNKNSLHASAARGQTNRHSDDPAAVRRHLAGCRSRPELHRAMHRSAPELFPAGFDQGYCLHGFGRESLKLSGLKLRKIVLANGTPTGSAPASSSAT